MLTFQEILRTLSEFWEKQGCIIHQGYDLEVGAGTFNPATFLRALGPEPYRAAYVEPSRRPTDGRYGENPIRFQHYFQYQVVLKPSPPDILELYLKSLEALGFDLSKHDIRFVHDDWESPTLGAWGLGWEVWMDGMEVTQFTYFQSLGGQDLKPVTGEITYGIERLATFLQGVDSTFKLQWSGDIAYGDVYKRNEYEWSHYNFEQSDAKMWFRHFEDFEQEAKRIIQKKLPLPAYDFVMKASHAFNMLDARGAISVSERASYIARIRELSRQIAELYTQSREEMKYPLLERFSHVAKEEPAKTAEMPKALLTPKEGQSEDFLLEVGVEELPAIFVPIGIQGLEKGLRNYLEEQQIPFKKLSVMGTPRRLTAYVEGLALMKPAKSSEKRGPALSSAFDSSGKAVQAGMGFFRSLQLDAPTLEEVKAGRIPQVRIVDVKGVDYLMADIREPSRPTAELLQAKLADLVLKIDFPKKMRWGAHDIAFARPIRWIVALFGKEVLPFTIGPVASGRISRGHRQMANHPVEISDAPAYFDIMQKNFVAVDPKEREKSILAQLDKLEKEMGGKAIAREKVIPQVVNLVEWPMLTYADFDQAFLKCPKEILISEMVEHQKYFPVEAADKSLKNLFVVTANNTPSDLIRKGNQKVLTARLKDGTFLYEQDLKVPLETFAEKLKTVTFMKGLGSLYDKTERLKKHAEVLLKHLPIADKNKVARAAHLSKTDLVSGVVYEFPELQGIIGKIYALNHGEDKDVAASIDEQWMPRGENAPLPQSSTGTILSLADKIDNIIACFGMNLKPTSSSDPYALRRQVLGIIKILIQGQYRLPLSEVIAACIPHFPKLEATPDELVKEISQFVLNRIKTVFLDYNLGKDEIDASLSHGFNDIYDIYCRINALRDFRTKGKQFPLLFEVYKRAKGQIPNGKPLPFSTVHLKENAEKSLNTALEHAEKEVAAALKQNDYSRAYQHLATLQPPLNQLFDEVKILDDNPDLKQNRLALLQRVFGLFGQLIDFSKIQNT